MQKISIYFKFVIHVIKKNLKEIKDEHFRHLPYPPGYIEKPEEIDFGSDTDYESDEEYIEMKKKREVFYKKYDINYDTLKGKKFTFKEKIIIFKDYFKFLKLKRKNKELTIFDFMENNYEIVDKKVIIKDRNYFKLEEEEEEEEKNENVIKENIQLPSENENTIKEKIPYFISFFKQRFEIFKSTLFQFIIGIQFFFKKKDITREWVEI
jgi:hypothetical protein